jgi:ferritin-like metal-binding protein YciE
MGNEREALLVLLHRVLAMEREAELLLRKFHALPALDAELASHAAACLDETLEHRRLIGNCIKRIEGKTDENDVSSPTPMPNLPTIRETDVAGPPASPDANLERLYQELTLEIASYTSVVAAAESAGFFETRLVCDSILSHKSSMANWLLDRLPPRGELALARTRPLPPAEDKSQ